jgi:hypothetical protein
MAPMRPGIKTLFAVGGIQVGEKANKNGNLPSIMSEWGGRETTG